MKSKTLVCAILMFFFAGTSFAISGSKFENSESPSDLSNEPKKQKSLEELDVVVTPAPNVKVQPIKANPRYLFKRNLSIRAGLFLDLKDNSATYSALGLAYLIPNEQRDERMVTNWELAMDLLFGGSPFVSYVHKWTYQPKEKFRYTFRTGAAVAWVAEENLAAFVNYKNYAVQGSAGIEYWIFQGISAKLEADAFVGADILTAAVTLGCIFAF